jgi:hypothetical protein
VVWELREHDVDQVMREVRDAVRYWEEHPEDAEALVRVAVTSGRFDSPLALSPSGLRAAVSQAVAAGQTDFRTIVTRYQGWKGRLEHAYKRVVRKSTSWLFLQQAHANRSFASAVDQLAEEVARLSVRVKQLEAALEQDRGRSSGPPAPGRNW